MFIETSSGEKIELKKGINFIYGRDCMPKNITKIFISDEELIRKKSEYVKKYPKLNNLISRLHPAFFTDNEIFFNDFSMYEIITDIVFDGIFINPSYIFDEIYNNNEFENFTKEKYIVWNSSFNDFESEKEYYLFCVGYDERRYIKMNRRDQCFNDNVIEIYLNKLYEIFHFYIGELYETHIGLSKFNKVIENIKNVYDDYLFISQKQTKHPNLLTNKYNWISAIYDNNCTISEIISEMNEFGGDDENNILSIILLCKLKMVQKLENEDISSIIEFLQNRTSDICYYEENGVKYQYNKEIYDEIYEIMCSKYEP